MGANGGKEAGQRDEAAEETVRAEEPKEESREEGGEYRPQIAARKPRGPTKAEVDAHFPLHLEYREWCAHCRAGRGVSDHHHRGNPEEEPLGCTISLDYLFAVPEEEDEHMDAVLLVYDSNRRNMWTMAVDKKGATPAAVKWVNDRLNTAGYAGMEITMKSDQEPAILELKNQVAIKRQAQTNMIESPVRESKSNGSVERAIKTWQAQFRTIRHFFESRIGCKLKKGYASHDELVDQFHNRDSVKV